LCCPFLDPSGLYNLLHRLWKRFYYNDPPAELYREYKAYMNGTGDFQAMHNFMHGMRLSSEKEGMKLNPLEVWDVISIRIIHHTTGPIGASYLFHLPQLCFV